MRTLTADRLTRRILATAGLGALADWITFSALVAVVAGLTGGSVFAVALVACARLVPAVVLGPVVAPFVGVVGLRPTLVAVDAVRAGAVLSIGFAPRLWVVVAALLALELAGALGSATREAAISGGIDPAAYPAVNAATATLGYGMLPVGGLVTAAVLPFSPVLPFLLSAAGYAGNAAVMDRTRDLDGLTRRPTRRVRAGDGLTAVRRPGPLRAVVTAAVIGVVPVVMLFSVARVTATVALGASQSRLLALMALGALAGVLAAQRRVTATTGLLVAAAGSAALLGSGWSAHAGVVAIGAGAGVAYVGTQSRLQAVARGPEEFAAAFAAVKVGTLAALLAAPAVHTVGGHRGVAATMVTLAALGGWWYAARVEGPGLTAHLFRMVGRPGLALGCRIRVEGVLPPGGAVLVANHPNAFDGPLAVWLDRRVRPVAKPQRHVLARLGFALSGTIVRGRAAGSAGRATDAAISHLREGGVVWLAPTGGCTDAVLGPGRTGAARMAAAAAVPLVVMAIFYGPSGTDPRHAADPRRAAGPRLWAWRPWRRPTVRIVLGAPRAVPAGADLDAATDGFMQELAAATGLPYVPEPVPAGDPRSTPPACPAR